jgi:hypothetical protein
MPDRWRRAGQRPGGLGAGCSCQASDMAFDLHRADGEVIRFGNDARFSFTATGHLVVYDAAGNKTVFSHHSWNRIEEPVPPPGE